MVVDNVFPVNIGIEKDQLNLVFVQPKQEADVIEIDQEDDFDKIYKGEISKSGAAILPSKRVRRMPEKIATVKENQSKEDVNPTELPAENDSKSADNKKE